MKVHPIIQRNINFKTQEPNIIGFDDEISQKRRNYIREHYDTYIMPNYNIYEQNRRLEKYELQKLTSSLLGKKVNSDSIGESYLDTKRQKIEDAPNKINSNLMDSAPMHNVAPIYRTQSWRGSVSDLTIGSLKLLKKAGIKTVVNLDWTRPKDEDFAKQGLNYFRFPLNIFDNDATKTEEDVRSKLLYYAEINGTKKENLDFEINSSIENWKINKNECIEQIVKFIQTMQSENVYIGCKFGTYKTDNALVLNSFFNPQKRTLAPINQFNEICISDLMKIVQNLTEKNKKDMGWTKEFELNLIEKLKKFI